MKKAIKKDFEGVVVKSLDTDDERTLSFVVSTEDVDRSGDIVRLDGWELDFFKEKGVFLWNHDKGQAPIGTPERVDVTDKGLEVDVRFPSEGVYDKADLIYDLYAEGIMKAVSAGFMALEAEPIKETGGFEYKRQSLIEVSAVPIGDNPNALMMKAKEFGLGEEVGMVIKSYNAKSKKEEDDPKDDPKDDKYKEIEDDATREAIQALASQIEKLKSKSEGDPKEEEEEKNLDPEVIIEIKSVDELEEGEEFHLPPSFYENEDPTEYEWDSSDPSDDEDDLWVIEVSS